MNHPTLAILGKILSRKIAVILLVTGSAAAGFAALGDGKVKKEKPRKALLSERTTVTNGTFSLKSGYTYRGNNVFNVNSERSVSFNTVVNYQKGHTTYVLPLKKKVILENVTIDISNRQLRRN